MNAKKPTYKEMEKKLAEAEELLAKLRRNVTKTTKGERDAAVDQRDVAIGDRDTARGERNIAESELDTAKDERDTARDERDTARGQRDTARGQRNTAVGERDTAVDERDTAVLGTKEIAEAYIASEQNFKNSIDASPLGIRIVTEDGDLIYANKAILNICGYDNAEELAAVPRSKLYTPESYAAHQERKKKRKLKESAPAEYEISIRRPDGAVRVLQAFRREVIWGGEKQFMVMYQDITEHKQAEEALRESEEKFHSIVEHSNDGIVFIQDGIVRYCNSKMLEIGSYTEGEVLGKPFINFVSPEHRDMVFDIYSKRVAGKTTQERYDLNLLGKGGRKIYAEISASLMTYEQNQVDIAIVRDVTERKKAEEQLENEALRRRILIEQSSDGIVVLDHAGKVYEANQRFADMLGYSMEEARQISVFDWEFQFPRERLLEMLRTVDEAGDHFETKHRRKDGTVYDVEISTNGATFAGQKLIFCVCRDITQRKQAEEALRESEREKAAILNGVSELVTYQDRELKLIWANRAAGESVGISPEKLVGGYCYEIWQKRSEPCVGCPVAKSFATGQPQQAEMVDPGGRIWFVRGYPVRDEKGSVTGVTEITLEITERKKAEEALKESEERYRSTLDNMMEGCQIIGRDWRYRYVNDTAAQHGHLKKEEMLGHTMMEAYPGIEKTAMFKVLRDCMEKRISGNIENEFVYPDGTKGFFALGIQPAPEGLFILSLDISERKLAEEALHESERKLRTLFEILPVGVSILDAERNIAYLNPALERILDISKEDLFKGDYKSRTYLKPDGTVMPPEEYASARAIKEQRAVHNVLTGVVKEDGNVIWTNVSAVPVAFPDWKVVIVTSDITESKRAEEAIKESEARFRSLFETMAQGVIYHDASGKVISANPAAERIMGLNLKQMIGKTTPDPQRKRLREDGTDFPAEQHPSIVALRTGKPVDNVVMGVFNPVGNEYRWILISAIPEFKEGKKTPYRVYTTFTDITDRKNLQEELVRDRADIKLILDTSPELIFYKDKEGKFLRVNRAFTQAMNIPEEDFIGKTVFDLYSADIARSMTNDDRGVFVSGSSKLDIVEQYESAAGVRWVRTDKVPVFDKHGNAVGLIGFAQDITAQKQAEIVIHRSEERFRQIFQESPLGIALSNLDYKFTMMNARFCKMFGYSEQELLSMTFKDISFPEDVPVSMANLQKLAKGELSYYGMERRYIKKNKEVIWSSLTVTLLHDNSGNPLGFMAMIEDITERKQAEQRINHLNLALRSIRDVSQLITREKDRDKLLKGICDAFVETRSFFTAWIVLLDESRQVITYAQSGVSADFTPIVEAVNQGKLPSCVQKSLKKKQVLIIDDPRSMCADCPIITETADFGSMAVRLEYDGIIYGVLCASLPKDYLTDINEAELFQEVASDIAFALYNMDRESDYRRLEQERERAAKLESIGTLAGGIAHDFNNLLTGIMGNIGLVKTYVSPTDATYEMLNEAEAAALRARDLTQQLLTFARGGKPVKKISDIGAIFKESAAFTLRGSRVKLELSLPEDLWLVEADEGQMSQVINNLVINAGEAMPAGGTLKIQAENLVFKKPSSLPLAGGKYVHLEVKDTGVGIPPEHLQRIFEPYFTTKQRGSGLGLSTAYSIVKNHGGIILAESTLNKGSIFHIYLPAVKKAARGGKKLDAVSSSQAGGKILIMDDEEIIRKMLKNMLTMAGYTVELSADGAEAIEKYRQAMKEGYPFNAVIMDLTIPGGMGGREAVKKVLEIDPQATVIVSSGYATDAIMSDYKKYGFKAVIAKPYSVKQLQGALSGLLTAQKK